MRQTPMRAIAALATSFALAAAAQAQTATNAAMPIAAASMPQDCVKPKARHDHGAERGTPTSRSTAMPCGQEGAATAPGTGASGPKQPRKHDHGKFHKNS
jgi:uncharacterized low-complexity protein